MENKKIAYSVLELHATIFHLNTYINHILLGYLNYVNFLSKTKINI